MKTLILASPRCSHLASVLRFLPRRRTARQNQLPVAMNAQSSSLQTGSSDGESFNAPVATGMSVAGSLSHRMPLGGV
jgi:hypothetical protein